MDVVYYLEDFGTVNEEERKWYKERISNMWKDNKDMRRLLDNLSELILREGDSFVKDGKTKPECERGFWITDWPKNDFKVVLQELRWIADGWLVKHWEKDSPMALYRNIRHLIIMTAYQLKLRMFWVPV